MAVEIAAFVAQAARQYVVGSGPGSPDVEALVETLRAWSASDHSTTAAIGTLLWLGLVHDLDLESPPPSSALQAAIQRSIGEPILLGIAAVNLQFAARHHLDPNWRKAPKLDFADPDQAVARALRQRAAPGQVSFLDWLGLTPSDIRSWLRRLFDLWLEADRRSVHAATTGEALHGEDPPYVATHLLQAVGPVGQQELMRYLRTVQSEFAGARNTRLQPGHLFYGFAGWLATAPEDWGEEDLELLLSLAETATDSREAECRLLAAVRITEALPAAARSRAEARARELIVQAEQGNVDGGVDRWLPVCRMDGDPE